MGEFTEIEWEKIFSEMEANPDLYGLPEVCHVSCTSTLSEIASTERKIEIVSLFN